MSERLGSLKLCDNFVSLEIWVRSKGWSAWNWSELSNGSRTEEIKQIIHKFRELLENYIPRSINAATITISFQVPGRISPDSYTVNAREATEVDSLCILAYMQAVESTHDSVDLKVSANFEAEA